MINSWEEFKTFVEECGSSGHYEKDGRPISKRRHKERVYILSYPDKLKWDHGVYRQAQMTFLQISGGPTGAGSRNDVILCRQSEVMMKLKLLPSTKTHAMIVSVGMLFVVTDIDKNGNPNTPFTHFDEFCEGTEYMKAHIISKPGQKAHIHHQHIELNLQIWRLYNRPNIYHRMEKYVRSPDNYHDDYTPPWIKFNGLPKIINFSDKERVLKAYSYGNSNHEYQNNIWKRIEQFDYSFSDYEENNNYFHRLKMNYMDRDIFYVQNNEYPYKLSKDNSIPFNLIISPCSGYNTEYYCNILNMEEKN